MVNTLRLKHLKEITEDAISKYSEDIHCAGWYVDVEYEVLDVIRNKDNRISFFKEYQVNAMNDLIRDGYWIRWKDTDLGERDIVLYRLDTK